MKIFLDTNVVMDYLVQVGRPNCEATNQLLSAIKQHPWLVAYISVQSLTDCAFFFTKKSMTSNDYYLSPIRSLISFVRLRPMMEQNAYEALSGEFSDFEDEMQLRCAIDAECAYFITGDKEILEHQPFKLIKAMHPAEFLAIAASQPH